MVEVEAAGITLTTINARMLEQGPEQSRPPVD
jgi:hypothetical protein